MRALYFCCSGKVVRFPSNHYYGTPSTAQSVVAGRPHDICWLLVTNCSLLSASVFFINIWGIKYLQGIKKFLLPSVSFGKKTRSVLAIKVLHIYEANVIFSRNTIIARLNLFVIEIFLYLVNICYINITVLYYVCSQQ